jgi:hypothetical protein
MSSDSLDYSEFLSILNVVIDLNYTILFSVQLIILKEKFQDCKERIITTCQKLSEDCKYEQGISDPLK